MVKIVLIGANHSGIACANTVLAKGGENELVIFEKNSKISFLGCGTALWISDLIKDPSVLFYCSEEELSKKGAKIHTETEVTNIDFDKKMVYAINKDGKTYEERYDKLVLSTGSLPIIPDIPGNDLENVLVAKLFQDAERIIEKLKNPDIKNITVVGAGYIGVELVEAFKKRGKNVTLVSSSDTVLSGYYDDEFGIMMNNNLSENGINLCLGECVLEIQGKDGKVSKVITTKNTYDADMVILSTGFRANTDLGRGKLELFKDCSYKVNRYQETSVNDVYATGDCAAIYDNSIDEYNYIALATNAVRSGIVGGHNASGTALESIGVQGSNGINIYGLGMFSTGITLRRAKEIGMDVEYTEFEDYQKLEFMKENNDKVKLRIVYRKDNRQIVGAQLASRVDVSSLIHMFSLAIQEKVTIDKLALTDIFFLPHFNKPYNYITMAAITAK